MAHLEFRAVAHSPSDSYWYFPQWKQRASCAVLMSLALFIPGLLSAQRVSGVVRDSASGAILGGAVVIAMDPNGRQLARGVADGAGRFRLQVPATVTQLSVRRIGFRPQRREIRSLTEAEELTLDVTMSRIPALLGTVIVSDERICPSREDRGPVVTIWEQARAGLLSSVLAREAFPAQAVTYVYERTMDLPGMRVIQQQASSKRGLTTRPFIAGGHPQELAEKGYAKGDGSSLRYMVPDADVLLDESFARTHCFHLRVDQASHPGEVGLAFEPTVVQEGVVEVKGTLWLGTDTAGIRSLEFTYVDKAETLSRAGARGELRFRALPNGFTFVESWLLRLPVFQPVRIATPAVGRRVHLEDPPTGSDRRSTGNVVQMSETGGVVLSARWMDGTAWQAGLLPLSGIARDSRKQPASGAVFSLAGTSDSVTTDSSGHFLLAPVLPGRYTATMTDTSMMFFAAERTRKKEIVITETSSPALEFELPSRAEVLRTICEPSRVQSHGMLIGRVVNQEGGPLPRDARVVAAWLSDNLPIRQETQTVGIDASGRFSLCEVPPERVVRLELVNKSSTLADTSLLSDPGGLTPLEWRVNPRDQRPGRLASLSVLRGRVLSHSDSTPLAGVELFLPATGHQTTSDSAGHFRFDHVSPGFTLLQARRIGFSPARDTFTVLPASDRVHAITLVRRVSQLDTVRVTASQRKYISSALNAFETRRLRGDGGYFVSDSALREHDGKGLSSIILSRVSGLKLVPGPGGAAYMVSSRKNCAGFALGSSGCSPCYVTVYVDGVQVYSALTPGTIPDANRILVREIAGLEYYPSSGVGPAEYNATGSGCGTLLIWTREG